MDFLLLRKLQLVRLILNRMEHPEWPIEICLQIPIVFDLVIFAVQPNFLVGSVIPRFDSFIVSLLLEFLGMVEIFSTNNH